MRKILWLVVSGLMALSLVMAACGPAATPTTPSTPTTPTAPTTPTRPVEEKTQQEAVKPGVEAPKHGGTISILQSADILGFDNGAGLGGVTVALTHDTFAEADWARGPAGTNEIDFEVPLPPRQFLRPLVAESFEIPEIGTLIFNIRKGVRYSFNPALEASRLVNGREFTADDAIASFKRHTSAATLPSLYRGAPDMSKNATIEKTGPYQVTIKTPVEPWWGFISFVGAWAFVFDPPELIQKYGNAQAWDRSVGTGPYMLTDFVAGSVATLKRNPNYWDRDPVGPGKGNQLPYIDTVRILIVPDLSTQMAAIRTARADWVSGVIWEEANNLRKTAPNLQSRKYTFRQTVIGMRTDKPDLPFKDKRVRQALLMATDFDSLKNNYYGGEAAIIAWPLQKTRGFEPAYMGLEELPAPIQEFYKYNPERAKKLLAEAGYPNGFKTKIIVNNVFTSVDLMSAIKAMWAKAGVDLQLDIKDAAVYTSLNNARNYDEMLLRLSVADPNN
ncbi:MAG: ABC transporter substrate-binding protein, partial [Chloroflexota bacterium]